MNNNKTILILISAFFVLAIIWLIVSRPQSPKIQLPNTEISLEASPTENPQGGGITPESI